MAEFFKGWRRKVGCVTLVMACVFTAGWFRSLSHEDELVLLLFNRMHSVGFEPGWISWWSWNDPSKITWPRKPVEWNTRLIGSRPETIEEFEAESNARAKEQDAVGMPASPTVISFSAPPYPWSKRRAIARAVELRKRREIRRRSREFGEGDSPIGEDVLGLSTIDESPAVIGYPEIRAAKLSCPYWVIVNSLGLLSLPLILGKPRSAKQRAPFQPPDTAHA